MNMPFHTRVIGQPPPGVGDSPDYIRLSRPKFTQSPAEWDTCEELLWCKNLTGAELVDGYERSTILKPFIDATSRFWLVNFTELKPLAGYPVIRVTSKGWFRTKPTHWQGRREVQLDIQYMNLGGFSYATSTAFNVGAASMAISVLTAPGNAYGLGSVLSPSYSTTFPYYFIGAGNGWFHSRREYDTLPGTTANKVTDTWTRRMKYDGTNGV